MLGCKDRRIKINKIKIKEDFLEKYPNAPIDFDDTPTICPSCLGFKNCCTNDCKECWNRPMEE